MAGIPVTGFSHVRLTVTDIERSRAFYDQVFGFDVGFEVPADADEKTREELWWLFGGVVYLVPGGFLGLRPTAPGDDQFSEDRAGLDHVSFALESVDELNAAAGRLDELGIAHEPVKDIGVGHVLEFRDPDNVALELFVPAN